MAQSSRPARIWYQSFVHPVEQAPYIERLQAFLHQVAAPDIRFEVHGLDPPDRHFHPLTEFRCAAQVIRYAVEAERNGYDAFVIGHFQEPGLLEIRGAVDIPVIGLGEANLLAALGMGLVGITEGAIPFAAGDPFRVIPSIMLGSMVAATIAMLGGVGDHAPHGGPIVLPVIDHRLVYLCAIVAGAVVTAVSINLLKTLTEKPAVIAAEKS